MAITDVNHIQAEDTPCHLASELSKDTVSSLTRTQAKEFAKVLKHNKSLSFQIVNTCANKCSNTQDNIFAVERLDAKKVVGGSTLFKVFQLNSSNSPSFFMTQ